MVQMPFNLVKLCRKLSSGNFPSSIDPQTWGNPTFCCTCLEGDPERRGRRARPGALRAALQDSQRLHHWPTSEFSPRQITGSFQHQHFQPPTSFKAYLAQSCESSANFLPYVSQFPACLPSAIRVIGPVSCFSEPPVQGCHSAYEVGLQEIGPVSARRNQWGLIH
jgi:hypothetical protein